MTIEDIFSEFPDKAQLLAQEMSNKGLSCVGCSAATYETLEVGMYGHGFEDEEINKLVGKLNEILAEEYDLTTIVITKRAADKYRSVLQTEGKDNWGIRLGDKPGGCSGFEYILDFSEKALEGDKVFICESLEIHVHEKVLSRMLGSVIDYIDGLNGAGFKVTNPNVTSSCACGKSQSY